MENAAAITIAYHTQHTRTGYIGYGRMERKHAARVLHSLSHSVVLEFRHTAVRRLVSASARACVRGSWVSEKLVGWCGMAAQQFDCILWHVRMDVERASERARACDIFALLRELLLALPSSSCAVQQHSVGPFRLSNSKRDSHPNGKKRFSSVAV